MSIDPKYRERVLFALLREYGYGAEQTLSVNDEDMLLRTMRAHFIAIHLAQQDLISVALATWPLSLLRRIV